MAPFSPAERFRTRALDAESRASLDSAQASWLEAIKLEPRNPDLRREHARFLARHGNPIGALAPMLEAYELCDARADIGVELGHLLLRCGRYQHSRVVFTGIDPQSSYRTSATIGLAMLHERHGQCEQAMQLLDGVEPEGNDAALALQCRVACLLRCDQGQRALDEVDRQLPELRRVSSLQRSGVLFLRGHCLDRLQRYAEAYASITEANQLAEMPHDPSMHTLAARRAVDETWPMPALPKEASRPRPIFIVGMPRSGTTLLERILLRHSQIASVGESDAMSTLAEYVRTTCGQLEQEIPASTWLKMRHWYLAHAEARVGTSSLVIDKMPGNYLYIPLILGLFPDALILDCRRQREAIAWSVYAQNFGGAQAFSTRPSWIARRIREHEALMTELHCRENQRLIRTDYEALVLEPESTIRRILQACGLAFERDCLTPHRHVEPSTTASYAQVQVAIHTDAREHWRNYGTWLARDFDLIQPEAAVAMPSAAAGLRHAGG